MFQLGDGDVLKGDGLVPISDGELLTQSPIYSIINKKEVRILINENHPISKSRPLLAMRNSGYTLGEFKILDIYLSRINPLDPKTAAVKITKAEYCRALGIDSGKVRTEQLKKYTAHFLGNVVTLDRPDGKKGYVQKVLFTTAEYDEDNEEIVLQCNPEPLIFNTFFNVQNVGYVRYILKNTLHLKSLYSYKLYLFIKSKLPATEFQVDLVELREKMGATAQKHESFKYFNRDALSVAVEEINANTDTYVEWEKITKGRITKGIRFKIAERVLQDDVMDGQMDIDDFISPSPEEPADDPQTRFLVFLSEACDGEFNLNQIQELLDLAKDHVERSMAVEQYQMDMYDYLRRKYLSLANKKGVNSKFGYMKFLVSANK